MTLGFFWIRSTNVENVESGTPSLHQTLKWIIVVGLLFSCLRAGLTLVEFKGTYDNELDKSQRFLKIDWTKRKRERKSVGNAWAVLQAQGENCWEEEDCLGLFTKLRIWLLSRWIGGFVKSEASEQARLAHSACSPLSPVVLQHGVGVGEGTNK